MAPVPPGEHTYLYARPALTVDTVVVAAEAPPKAPPKVLLIRRGHAPFEGMWATPGGFVDAGETMRGAAARELAEETTLDAAAIDLVQVGVFDTPGRDPRGWIVGAIYGALVPAADPRARGADDAVEARWFDVSEVPLPLACDHQLVLAEAFRRLAAEAAAMAQPAVAAALRAAAERLDGAWQISDDCRAFGAVEPASRRL
jgi:8-oxo-dGTP diphosphatase